jgi:undecaprenyl-diphosphatase
VRRRWGDAALIVGGPLLIWVAVHVVKDIEQRRRPPGPLTPASGYSFPSSAAALSITAIAVGLALAHLASGRSRAGRAAIAAGVALSAGTGILMVAIRVHYLTDVIGGWGLGIAVFAAWALLVAQVRRSVTR